MIALHGRARALVGCVMGLLLVGCSDDEHGGTAAAAGEAASAGQAGDEAPSAGDGGADSSQGGSASNGGALGPGLGGDTSDAGDGNLVEVFCGNGLVDGDDECERLEGCKADQKCTASCSCEAVATPPPSSQRLIEAALRAGDIDYATSLKLRVWALYQAPELPEAYDGDGSLGEDTYLYFELSRIRGKLPADVEAAIAPYLTRPNDPTSIFSQAPSALSVTSRLPNVAAAEVTPPPVGCALNDVGQPDWRAHETKHFVVWSCGGGVGGTDDYAAGRVLTGTLAEQIWGDMTPKLKVPHKDDYAVGPGDQQRTDIYILGLNQCRWRAGFCTPVKGTEMAAAAPATPCGRENGGPLVSSAYMVIGGAHVPSVASGAQFSKLRYILAHEFFHAMSFNINLEAQGGVCASTGPDLPPEEARSWLTEASAEWASFAFYAADETERRSILFEMFQPPPVWREWFARNAGLAAVPGFLVPAVRPRRERQQAGQDARVLDR